MGKRYGGYVVLGSDKMADPVFRLEGVIHTQGDMEDFEGPLSLILQLLSKNKIEIISL